MLSPPPAVESISLSVASVREQRVTLDSDPGRSMLRILGSGSYFFLGRRLECG